MRRQQGAGCGGDDTAVVGRILNNDESEDMKGGYTPPPLYIGGAAVEVVQSIKYLGVYIASDLTWRTNSAALVKKAHQHLYFLRRLRRAGPTVLCAVVACDAVPVSDLLDRASQRSDALHSLSTTLAHDLDFSFSPVGRMVMPRPSMCHTSSLQTPTDKEQALLVSESDLLSLARSLLQAWLDPLAFMSTSAKTLPHPAQNGISSKIRELQEHSKSLGDGLDVLSGKLGPAAQAISFLPFKGSNDMDHDKFSRLANLHFLLSCFRRDSHKIDSFLKVLRCRAARMQPDMC
ncbi:prolactin [Brachionichthys hirsutus]|uniref:prolactin n=1 Tax=Brachionichthys hirsutus TaxID=412623 RepID=UPI00360494A4